MKASIAVTPDRLRPAGPDSRALPPGADVAAGGVAVGSGPRLARRAAGLRSSAVRDLLADARRPDMISFAGGLPSPEGFEADAVREAFSAVLADAGHALQYGETEGEPQLREALARWSRARGVPADAGRILVTTGSQQALDLVARLLVDDGDTVAVARPTYLAALSVFRLTRARLVGLRGDAHGPLPEALEEAALGPDRLRMLYLVPDFANPTGETIGTERRRALLAVAARHGVVVVEDSPYAALRFRGEAPRPLSALAGEGPEAATVIHVSSLSKVMAPGLRVGWMVLPESLFAAAVRIKQALDLHTCTVTQLAAARLLQSGRLESNLPGIVRRYQERHDAMQAALRSAFGEALVTSRPEGGMFVWARQRSGRVVDTSRWLRAGLELGVMFVPGEAFYDDEPDPACLRLCFATTPPARIEQGVERLAKAWRLAGGAA